MFFNTLKTVLFLVFVVFVEAGKLPSSFTACKLQDDECLAKSIETALKSLKSGLPELGIPSIDPMDVTSLVIGAGTGAVHLVQNYANVKMIGFSDVTVKDAHFDASRKVLKFTSMHPKLTQKAKYDINGKILVLPVYGKGDSEIILEGVTLIHEIHLTESRQDSAIYYTPETYTAKITITHGEYHFDNLFNGNKAMGDNINAVINQEWKPLFDDVKSGIEASYASIFMTFAKRVFAKIPAEEMFLA